MGIVRSYYTQPPYPIHSTFGILNLGDNVTETSLFMALCQLLEEELQAAKRGQLSCSKIVLPAGLLKHIARDVIEMSRNEPCGFNGCKLYLYFLGEYHYREISIIKCDTSNVFTFELYLTLKQNTRNRWSFIPVFIRNLIEGVTIVFDNEYNIEKKRLYRSFLE